MFDNFPKQRPFLPEGIRAIYSEHYKSNRGGKTVASSLSQKMESWLHRQVAKDLASAETSDQATLELGAGNLNQLSYESGLQVYDIVEPFKELYENSLDRNRIRNFLQIFQKCQTLRDMIGLLQWQPWNIFAICRKSSRRAHCC